MKAITPFIIILALSTGCNQANRSTSRQTVLTPDINLQQQTTIAYTAAVSVVNLLIPEKKITVGGVKPKEQISAPY